MKFRIVQIKKPNNRVKYIIQEKKFIFWCAWRGIYDDILEYESDEMAFNCIKRYIESLENKKCPNNHKVVSTIEVDKNFNIKYK